MIYTNKKDIERIVKESYKKEDGYLDYYIKSTSVIVQLNDRTFYEINKPRIETEFYCGYGMYGISSQEEMQDAYDYADEIEHSETIFKNKNLQELNDWINLLQEYVDTYPIDDFIGNKYIAKYGGYLNNFINIQAMKCTFDDFEKRKPDRLSKEDAEEILNGYKVAKELFTKRLDRYLKRYGMSKVSAHTYLVD